LSRTGLDGSAPEPGKRARAPGDLAVVQAFINTNDREGGKDGLASPEAVKHWFITRRLMARGSSVSIEQYRRAIQLREALRQLAIWNTAGQPESSAFGILDQEAERSGLMVHFSPGGRLRFGSTTTEFDLAIATILATVANAFVEGTWHRLKACARDICQWVFYDRSRNHSAVWCAMSICGSREKARGYYRRHRA